MRPADLRCGSLLVGGRAGGALSMRTSTSTVSPSGPCACVEGDVPRRSEVREQPARKGSERRQRVSLLSWVEESEENQT